MFGFMVLLLNLRRMEGRDYDALMFYNITRSRPPRASEPFFCLQAFSAAVAVSFPSAPIKRWQGMTSGMGLVALARPTAR